MPKKLAIENTILFLYDSSGFVNIERNGKIEKTVKPSKKLFDINKNKRKIISFLLFIFFINFKARLFSKKLLKLEDILIN